jgi:plastocyanin
LLLGAATVLVAAPAFAATYTGIAKAPAVVWISDPQPLPSPSSEPVVRQTMKTFEPDLVIVPVGTSVTFPNDDPFYHSVYSESPGNAFDLGLYDTGPGKAVRFDVAGIVDVHCHIHRMMHATIVVVDGPFVQTTQPNQRYRFDGLRAGNHVLHVWTGGTDVTVTEVRAR